MTRSLPKFRTPCKSMFPSTTLLRYQSWNIIHEISKDPRVACAVHPEKYIQFASWYQFINHVFPLGLLLNMSASEKHTFLISIREYGFQQIHIQNFGCFQFYKACFSIGASAETGRLQENYILTSIWDSGSQRKHIRVFAWFQFYKACFPVGAAAETSWHQESCVLNIYLGFWISTNTYPRFRSISVL